MTRQASKLLSTRYKVVEAAIAEELRIPVCPRPGKNGEHLAERSLWVEEHAHQVMGSLPKYPSGMSAKHKDAYVELASSIHKMPAVILQAAKTAFHTIESWHVP